MKKILIVGASSCIGSNLAVHLRNKNLVYGTYSKNRPNISGIPLIKLFLQPEAPIEDLVHRLKPDFTIYCVAQSNFLACEADPQSTQFLHEEAAARMASACSRHQGRFIYLSSSKVYSGQHGRYSEGHDADPICIYGSTKLNAERTLAQIGNTVSLRLGTIYGFGGPQHSAMLPRLLDGIWNTKREFQLVSDEYRTFTSVDEVCTLVEKFLEFPKLSGVFHVGNSERNSYFSFASKLANKLGLKSEHLRPISGKNFANKTAVSAIRGGDLTLISNKVMQSLKYRFKPVDDSLNELRTALICGNQ